MSDTVIETKSCVMCAESILIAARVCKHCEAYQDWRKWLSTSQATLALVIALVSVLGSGGPAMINAVRGENSQLTATYQSFVQGRALVIVVNTGSRPGSVANAELHITSDNQSIGESSIRVPLVASKAVDHLVPEGKSVALMFAPEESKIEAVERSFRNAELPPRKCYLKITLKEFNGKEMLYSSEQSCRNLIGHFWGARGIDFVQKHFPPEA